MNSMRTTLPTRLAAALLSFGAALILLLLPHQMDAQCSFTAGFNTSKVYLCAGETAVFTNTTTVGASIFNWSENSVPFASTTNATRTFNTPGNFLIGLVASNGTCFDTATTLVVVTPGVNSSTQVNDATCFGSSDGSIDLTPTAGLPNIAMDNQRTNNDYVTANSVAQISYANGITIEAWVKPNANWTSGDGLFSAFNTPTGGNKFFVGYHGGLERFLYYDGNVGNQYQNAGTSPRGTWAHVAVTITSGNFFTLYVNGVVRKSGNTNASWQPVANDLFSIGQEWDGTSTSQHFDGCIDEMRIFSTSLSAATVLSDYQNSCGSISSTHPNITSLQAYYSMNEGGGSFIFDRSGRGNHGTRSGSAWCTPAQTNYGCFSQGTGYSYTWSNAAITEDISGLSIGSYNVTITDGAGCQATNSATVGQPVPLVITHSSNPSDSICLGNSTQVTASGASTYTWSPGTGLSATTGATVTANPTASTNYTVIGTDGNGCKDTITVGIVVNPLPTASISGTNTVCQGDSTVLTASGGVSYAWSNSATTASTTVTPASATTYTVTVTDGNSCTDTDQITVNVNALPTVSITGTDTICVGDTTMLTASGGTGYSWSSGDLTATATLTPAVTTTYTVTVTDGNSCSNTDSTEVVVNPLPVVTFSGNDTICVGNSTTITASGGSSYSWSSGDLTAAATLSPAVTSTYTVTVTDGNSCEASNSIEIVVNPLPTASISGMDSICAGASTTLTASGGQSYVWSNSATTSSITISPAASGPVSVVATDANNCSDSDTIQITVTPQAIGSISPGDTAVCEMNSVTFTASGGTSYLWNTSDATAAITVTPVATTTYSVTVSDGSSCDDTVSVTLTINFNPATPVITQTGSVLSTDPGFANYQWFLNGNPVGTNSNTYSPTASGPVTVTVTDNNGCFAMGSFNYVAVNDGLASGLSVDLYPNPNNGLFTLQLESDVVRDLEVSVFDLAGRNVYKRDLNLAAGKWSGPIDLQFVAKGVYILQMRSGSSTDYRKVIVE